MGVEEKERKREREEVKGPLVDVQKKRDKPGGQKGRQIMQT